MDELFTKIIVQFGAVGVLGWVVYTLFKQSLPALVMSFENECQKNRDLFRDESKEQREANQKMLTEIRVGVVVDQQRLFAEELRLQRSDFRDELSKQRHAFVNVINALNLTNHDLAEQLKGGVNSEGDASDKERK